MLQVSPALPADQQEQLFSYLMVEILKSVLLNPLALVTNLSIFISLLWLIYELFTDRNEFMNFMKKDWNLKYKIIVVTIFLLNWIWNIKKGI